MSNVVWGVVGLFVGFNSGVLLMALFMAGKAPPAVIEAEREDAGSDGP